jgi:YVTN family beta-propeller protein
MKPSRTRTSRQARLRRTLTVATIIVTAAVVVTIASTRSSSKTTGSASTTPSVPRVTSRSTSPPVSKAASTSATYRETVVLSLGHAVADPAAGSVGTRVLFAGGLDASSTSTARVGSISGRTVHTLASLPKAFHDAAGAVLDNNLYLFGGGDGVRQLDAIVRVDANGVASTVGRLPAPSSDSLAATVGHTAYVVGGYTGAAWLDTIVAYGADHTARVVAHLPVGLRYPAVGAAGGRLIIAGGTTTNAHASAAIYSFDPATATVSKIGGLPRPISHAAAAGIGNEVVVAGGQNNTRQPQAGIVAIDAVTHRVRNAGTLLTARSDAALVNANGRLILIGGKAASSTLNTVSELVPENAHDVNVYAHDGSNALSPEATLARPLIYVPNSMSNTVDVIDPATYKVIDHFSVGALPQHVTPSWDFKTLYVDNDHGNSLTPINPRTGQRRGPDIAVTDPYNLYFTADGRYAIVVAEARRRLDFRDAQTMKLVKSVPVPCTGVDHMDYTADGKLALASCEFSGQLVVVDLARQSIRATINLPNRGVSPRPQDVKLSPDGTVFYVADMNANGVWEVDARTFAIEGFLPTGAGAHGLYPSRDARFLYVTNRDAGTISVVDFRTRQVVRIWTIPGGSPDMGGVSADGKVLWLSGRFSSAVYAVSTADGHVIATIPVGQGPHGLCVWPQPGRYSIGHTGITR